MSHPLTYVKNTLQKFLLSDAGWITGLFFIWRLGLTLWAGWSTLNYTPSPLEKLAENFGPVYLTFRQAQPLTNQMAAFFLDPWYRWDAGWFLSLALGFNDGVSGFAPFYPYLIRLLAPLTYNNFLLAGLIVANLAFLLALQLLFLYAKPVLGKEKSRLTILLILLFPFSFFFTSVYSESLYLFFLIATFMMARQQRWLWVIPLSVLTVLTRFLGVLLFLPLGWQYIQGRKIDPTFRWLPTLAVFSAPLTLVTYFIGSRLFNRAETASSPYFVQEFHWPWESLSLIQQFIARNPLAAMTWINLLLLLLCLILCFSMFKRLPVPESLYTLSSLGVLFITTINGTLLVFGLARYVLVVFPLYMLGAIWLAPKRWLKPLIFVTFGILQLGALWLFTHWFFIS